MRNEKNKMLVFDMDGTITDLYSVKDWLECIQKEDPKPYTIATPLYNMAILNSLLMILKNLGWQIIVTTWLAKDASHEYDNKVREAKKEWLAKYSFPYDEIHLVKYGTTKADCTRKKGGFQILIDDNEEIRKGWHLGTTIDANKNIITELTKIMIK